MSYKFAGFLPRLAAFMLDYLIIVAYMIFLTLITALLFNLGGQSIAIAISGNPYLFDLFAFLTLVLPVILYFALGECSPKQATWGKRKLKLSVCAMNGKRLSWRQSCIRSIIKFLPWQIAHTSIFHIRGWPLHAQPISIGSIFGFTLVSLLVGLYLVTVLFTKAHRTPYDWLSQAVVVDNSNI
jgi:uncharacterized RDD family membrane protein YckC